MQKIKEIAKLPFLLLSSIKDLLLGALLFLLFTPIGWIMLFGILEGGISLISQNCKVQYIEDCNEESGISICSKRAATANCTFEKILERSIRSSR